MDHLLDEDGEELMANSALRRGGRERGGGAEGDKEEGGGVALRQDDQSAEDVQGIGCLISGTLPFLCISQKADGVHGQSLDVGRGLIVLNQEGSYDTFGQCNWIIAGKNARGEKLGPKWVE